MVQYEEKDDRKILRARDCEVLEVKVDGEFFLRLTEGLVLNFSGTALHSLGKEGLDQRRPVESIPPDKLPLLISKRPLSWVVFNSAHQRIVFSNAWYFDLDPHPDGHWRLELGDGRVLEFPEAEE